MSSPPPHNSLPPAVPMATFDFDDDKPSDSEIVQRLESSLDFLVNENDDNPPAIRGVMAVMSDLQEDVRAVVQKIARDSKYPELELKRVLWFDDKNEKLDDACAEAKSAFRPYPVTADGLIIWSDPNNPLQEKPTQHRLVVSDEFARTNYDRPTSDEMIIDDEEESVIGKMPVKENSWKRKITQTIKPWRVKRNGKIVPARSADDLLLTMNALFSRTKHGWLVADLLKLKKRRGSMLVHAKTFEYQVKDDRRFEFMLQYVGAAAVYRKRLAETLSNLACLYLDFKGDGEAYVTKVSTSGGISNLPADAQQIEIPINARVVSEDGKPSQLVLKKDGKYFESKLLPLLEQGKPMSTKIDLRKSNSEEKQYRFNLKIELDGPLLVATSGDAAIFQLDDFLHRFVGTSLAKIRGGA